MTHPRRPTSGATSLGFALALATALPLAGCNGFTNPSAETIADPNKAGTRTDLPVPSGNPSQSEPLGDASTDYAREVGTGKGAASTTPTATATSPSEPTGSPPAKTDTGSTAGATRPSGDIKAGTPKSPQ